MSYTISLDAIPKQLFPDGEISKITINKNKILISFIESEWDIESCTEWIYGTGDMIFYYSGKLFFQVKNFFEEEWNIYNGKFFIYSSIKLELITRYDDYWAFYFRNENKEFLVNMIVPQVGKVLWTGEVDTDNAEFYE